MTLFTEKEDLIAIVDEAKKWKQKNGSDDDVLCTRLSEIEHFAMGGASIAGNF